MKMKPARSSPARVPQPNTGSALLLVHIQNDFCPGGTLAVPGADAILPAANASIRMFYGRKFPILATRDWHPANHCSFKTQGGPWPAHCVQGSRGAQFHPDLVLPPGTLVISSATDPKREAYSGFDGTTLEEHLRDLKVDTVFVAGLATDYCVKETVLSGCKLGFKVVLLEDAIRGIDVAPKDSEKAIAEMRAAGAVTATTGDLAL